MIASRGKREKLKGLAALMTVEVAVAVFVPVTEGSVVVTSGSASESFLKTKCFRKSIVSERNS